VRLLIAAVLSLGVAACAGDTRTRTAYVQDWDPLATPENGWLVRFSLEVRSSAGDFTQEPQEFVTILENGYGLGPRDIGAVTQ